MPKLEIISRRPKGTAKRTPLLFVHGAFCGAWIWDAKFLRWFADRGRAAHALSLRGHGRSEGRAQLRGYSLADYVEDVVTVFDWADTPPVLIGHSMGGMIVQRTMLKRRPPAAVLLASAPPYGLWEATAGLMLRDPYVFQQMSVLTAFGNPDIDPEAIRRAMFSDRVPLAEMARYAPLLQEESQRVLFDTMHWNPFPPLPDRDIPLLVMGAEKDLLIPPDQVRKTAAMLCTEAHILPEMAHTMMLEPDWESVAERIDAWLSETIGE